MNTYRHAKPGYKYALTARGFEVGRIRAKYEESYARKDLYESMVPASWFEKGYVTEVKDGEK